MYVHVICMRVNIYYMYSSIAHTHKLNLAGERLAELYVRSNANISALAHTLASGCCVASVRTYLLRLCAWVSAHAGCKIAYARTRVLHRDMARTRAHLMSNNSARVRTQVRKDADVRWTHGVDETGSDERPSVFQALDDGAEHLIQRFKALVIMSYGSWS